MSKSLKSKHNRRAFFSKSAIASAGLLGVTELAGAVRQGNRMSDSVVNHPASLSAQEPDLETAFTWWSELPNKWTPVGWKSHLFRFNVLFNGTLVAQPYLNRRTKQWDGDGVQIGIVPSIDGKFGTRDQPFNEQDDGSVIQGWNDTPTPVLRSEWAYDALLLRQEIFAHIPGGKPIESGVEPLFAWMRLSIYGKVAALPAPDRYSFALKINAPYIRRTMMIRNNLLYDHEISKYPRELHPAVVEYSPAGGYRLIESDDKIRLGVAPHLDCSVQVYPQTPTDHDYLMTIFLTQQKGAYVDLLIPMLPATAEVFNREISLGFDGALTEANRFWSASPAEATSLDIPDRHITKIIDHSLRTIEVLAERDPATGIESLLTGSWNYADVWATGVAATVENLLDNFGYHDIAEKYLAVYRRTQGTVRPPSDVIPAHGGYLASPKSLTAINWLTDHGALLSAISRHALLTGRDSFIRDYLPTILKACDFIRDARRIANHPGIKGLMPPGVATDNETQIQGVWTDGWMYRGLVQSVRLLTRIGHERAQEFEAEARDYHKTFLNALRQETASMPTWKDSRGELHHLTPTSLYGHMESETRDPFYLDTGPLFLVYAGLLSASDQLMKSTALWFREGPPTSVYRPDSIWWQVPSLRHEMSSCELNKSWNIFHSLQLGDRVRFLEGIYSQIAGNVSRQTYTRCETRGGITGVTPGLIGFMALRLAVIDDEFAQDELHLLRIIPLAWLGPNSKAQFENVPTQYGTVSLQAELSDDGAELRLGWQPHFRIGPKLVSLHVPPVPGLVRINLNGRALAWNGHATEVNLTS